MCSLTTGGDLGPLVAATNERDEELALGMSMRENTQRLHAAAPRNP